MNIVVSILASPYENVCSEYRTRLMNRHMRSIPANALNRRLVSTANNVVSKDDEAQSREGPLSLQLSISTPSVLPSGHQNFSAYRMGVPAFFVWLCERYPSIMRDVKPKTRREAIKGGVDNLYLDFNGIIQ